MKHQSFLLIMGILFLQGLAAMPVCAQSEAKPAMERYAVEGLPDRVYNFDYKYKNGTLKVLELAGTKGYLITPSGKIDPQRRWVWISPMYLALDSVEQRGMAHRNYIDPILAAGFHVAGIDIGVSAASPAGVAIYHKLYETLTGDEYKLNKKARCIAQSNGGLRIYGWAFRHPRCVERVFGIFPVTDMRDWPGLEKVIGPQSMVPRGVAYQFSLEELKKRLSEFNPIDNLKPLADAGVKIYHIHGDADQLVRLEPDSVEFGKRYKALGGDFKLDVIKGAGHNGRAAFYNCEEGLKFITGDSTSIAVAGRREKIST